MDKIKFLYSLDVRIVRLRKIIKRISPAGLVSKIKGINNADLSNSCDLVDSAYPWMSPNLWREIVFYSGLEHPAIVNVGIGASTINNLRAKAGLEKPKYNEIFKSI